MRNVKDANRNDANYADARQQMASEPSQSATLVRHDAKGKCVECGSLTWATNVEITRKSDDWQPFNRGMLLPLQKLKRNRNKTQRKWVEILLQKLLAKGFRLALDELPRRYISREFLTT